MTHSFPTRRSSDLELGLRGEELRRLRTSAPEIRRAMKQESRRARPTALFLPASGFHCPRSEEHTSELQSLMRISYAVFCLKKQIKYNRHYKYDRKCIVAILTQLDLICEADT